MTGNYWSGFAGALIGRSSSRARNCRSTQSNPLRNQTCGRGNLLPCIGHRRVVSRPYARNFYWSGFRLPGLLSVSRNGSFAHPFDKVLPADGCTHQQTLAQSRKDRLYLVRRPLMMDRSFHILPQASSNHLPIAAKKPRLEAALPCMPIADILRPTHGTYLLDAWYIPHHMTVSRSKPWSIPPSEKNVYFM